MTDVFTYPQTVSDFWLENHTWVSWSLGMLMLTVLWGIFFRFGKFNYGIDLGCIVKTGLIIFGTALCFGFPNVYNIKFAAEHSFEGDKLILTDSAFVYKKYNDGEKTFPLKKIIRIKQEDITFNPPVRYFVVAETDSSRRDSVAVAKASTTVMDFLEKLSARTGVEVLSQK
jgi:hypothetical protein